ncbi:DNA repair protein endonuclease SAE2/CtIP C-terminus-domain-containing protein [Sparassis latifolia]
MARTPAGPSNANKELEKKIRNLQFSNDELRKQAFMELQRGHRLASKMGFDSVEEAEAAIAAQPKVYNRDFLKDVSTRIEELESELEKSVQLNKLAQVALKDAREVAEAAQKENEELILRLSNAEAENNALKERLEVQEINAEEKAKSPSPPVVTGLQTLVTSGKSSRTLQDITPLSSCSHTRLDEDAPSPDVFMPTDTTLTHFKPEVSPLVCLELRELQRKYDALRATKGRSDEKYKTDYKKWREFKQWMCDLENESPAHLTGDKKKDEWRRVLRIRRQFKKIGPRLSTDVESMDENHVKDEHATPSVAHYCNEAKATGEALPMQVKAGPAPPSPVTTSRKRTFEEAMSSETEDDSQAPEPVYHTQLGLQLISARSPLRKVRSSPRPSPKRSPRPRRASASVPESISEDATHRQRTSKTSQHSATGTPKANGSGDKENVPGTGSTKRYPSDYSAFKGRGRYAASNVRETTVNSVYQINPAQNDGRDFPYAEVVRNKKQRKCLHGENCMNCRDYYENIGPSPPRQKPPLWRSPVSTPSKASSSHATQPLDADFDDDLDEAAQKKRAAIVKHQNEISRHRHQWEGPKTPPKYWIIGFPDTQEVAAINEQAREMHEQKRRKVEMEANNGGKYKKRR